MEYKKPEERIDGKSVVLTPAVSPIQEEQEEQSGEKEEESGSFAVKPSTTGILKLLFVYEPK